MASRLFAPVAACAAAISGCAQGPPVRSLADLEAVASGERAAEMEAVAGDAWDEASRYLELARRALDERDRGQAERFAALGLIHAKIAAAEARAESARLRTQRARAERAEVEEEIARVEGEIERIELEAERERIAGRLEEVVGEARRRADDEEPRRERALSEEDRRALEDARLEVGLEELARARVGLDLLRALADAGAVEEAAVSPVLAAVARAERLIGRRDAEAFLDLAERAGSEARRARRDAFGEGGDAAAREEISDRLASAGIEAFAEEWGVSVPLGGSLSRGGALSAEASDAVSRLAGALAGADGVAVLVLASGGTRGAPRAAAKRSSRLAKALSAALVEAGVDEEVVSDRGCGAASPIRALGGKGDRAAAIVAPVPEAR